MRKINVCILSGMLLSALAHAGCLNLRINSVSANGGTTMVPGTTKTIDVEVKKDKGSCSWFITVGYGGASGFAARRLAQGAYTMPIQLYKNGGLTQILKTFPDADESGEVLNDSGNGTVTMRAVLNSVAAYTRFGAYSDAYTLTLYEGTIGGSYEAATGTPHTWSLGLDYTILRQIDLSLVNTGDPYNASSVLQTMSFGTLSSGLQRAMDIVLMHNAGYRIKFSSVQNGVLKHSTLADTVPYSMTVADNVVNLSGSASVPVEVASGSGVNPGGGQRFHVVATIGNLGTASAGAYSDVITVTVISNE